MKKVEPFVAEALKAAEQGNLSEAQQSYKKFGDQWLQIESTVKDDSRKAYSDIESNMGQVQYAFMQNKQEEVVKALQGLQTVEEDYISGKYPKEQASQLQAQITLSDFVGMLQQARGKVQNHNQQAALSDITKVREAWLSVEGNILVQSAAVYNDSERDLVAINALISAGNYEEADKLIGQMVGYLTPLTEKTGYTMWDAAMIPIREGLEALLVVAALLTFVKKSNSGKGRGWIWSGIATGLAVSAVLAFIVKFVFSSGAFGQNNFLIAGWTGVIAAAMLLYMSYWLHSKSNIAEWNQYMKTKSQKALETGRLLSLGVLSFLAVFREGTETVLFIIGMVNQIGTQQLILGILIGFGILAVIAYLMLYVGIKLPMRPFFLVSSLIVFYLSLKFTGLGIHSLQLAGALPSTISSSLPSIAFLGFYPSWQSAIPQILLLLFALLILLWKKINTRLTPTEETSQAK